jgi:hypothetical protein
VKVDHASNRDGDEIFVCPIGNGDAYIDPDQGDGEVWCECGAANHTAADVEWALELQARVLPRMCTESEDFGHVQTCAKHKRWIKAMDQVTKTISDRFSPSEEESEEEPAAVVIDVPELGSQVRVFASEVLTRIKMEALRETSRDLLARHRQRPYAKQWYGRTGKEFDPAKPEPKPSRLKFSRYPELFMLTPGFHILFGPQSVLKTWICAEALRQEAHEGRVGLFIDYEDTYDDFFRKMHILGASEEERERIVYIRPPGPLTDDGREYLVRRFEEFGQDPALCVTDSIGQGVAAYGLDDNASGGNGVGRFIEDILMW